MVDCYGERFTCLIIVGICCSAGHYSSPNRELRPRCWGAGYRYCTSYNVGGCWGGVVSCTVTVNVTSTWLPALSFAAQVTVVVV
jgi:hypothetical protein